MGSKKTVPKFVASADKNKLGSYPYRKDAVHRPNLLLAYFKKKMGEKQN